MESDLLALHWMEHATVFSKAIGNLRVKTSFTDATLACDGQFYPVHKFVLSTCSQYFSAIFEWTPCINPVVVINNVTCKELEALLDFMYIGEVSVKESVIPDVMRAAECLKIRGLSIVEEDNTKTQSKHKNKSDPDEPPRKRKRSSGSRRSVSESDTTPPCKPSKPMNQINWSPPASAMHHHQSRKEEKETMTQTENHVPDLSTPKRSHRCSSESESYDSDLPLTPALNRETSSFLQNPSSSIPEASISMLPMQSLPLPPPNPTVNQTSQLSPSLHPSQRPSTLDHASHEQMDVVNINCEIDASQEKTQIENNKQSAPETHIVVPSEEIPDLLDSLVDMRPLYGSKAEPLEETVTFHAVESRGNSYTVLENVQLPSSSATSQSQSVQQEVKHPMSSSTGATNKSNNENAVNQKSQHKCHICNKEFSKIYSLNRHKRIHTKVPYSCKDCPYTSSVYKDFVSHMKTEHKSHKCTVCKFITYDSERLARHMVCHDKHFKCTECNYSAARIRDFEKHVKNKHDKNLQ